MTSSQAHRLEQIVKRLGASDGELLWLARHCAVDDSLVSLGALSRVDAEDMIETLETYERWLLDHGQQTAEEMMLDDLRGRELAHAA
jgi:hypothetical protein